MKAFRLRFYVCCSADTQRSIGSLADTGNSYNLLITPKVISIKSSKCRPSDQETFDVKSWLLIVVHMAGIGIFVRTLIFIII